MLFSEKLLSEFQGAFRDDQERVLFRTITSIQNHADYDNSLFFQFSRFSGNSDFSVLLEKFNTKKNRKIGIIRNLF